MKAGVVTACRYSKLADGRHLAVGALSYEALARYLAVFDEVIVISRRADTAAASPGAASGADGPGVSFATDRTGPEIWRWICAVREADLLILRLPSPFALLIWSVAVLTRTPFVVEVLGCARDSFGHHPSRLSRALARPLAGWTKCVVRSAVGVTYVTERFLQTRYPTRAPSVGVSDAWLCVGAPRSASSAERGLRLGSIGQVDGALKGFDVLVGAVAIAREDVGRLEILGRGTGSDIRARAQFEGVDEKVALIGTLPRGEAVDNWLRSLDVYVQASRTEGLSRSVLEAMAQSVPVVASRVGGLPEVVHREALFPVGDSEALASIVRRIAVDGEFRAMLSAHSLRMAEQHGADVQRPKWESFMSSMAAIVRVQ